MCGLGSGSARGWAHIGAIDALTDAGIQPDIVCGTSIGALVGAAYVAGRLTDLRQWAEAATWREIIGLMDVRFSGGGLIDGKEVVEFLRRLGIGAPIESYAKDYAAIATDIAAGREIWLQSGPIHEAVRASIALPAIFSPARINDKWLMDGGLSNPVGNHFIGPKVACSSQIHCRRAIKPRATPSALSTIGGAPDMNRDLNFVEPLP